MQNQLNSRTTLLQNEEPAPGGAGLQRILDAFSTDYVEQHRKLLGIMLQMPFENRIILLGKVLLNHQPMPCFIRADTFYSTFVF